MLIKQTEIQPRLWTKAEYYRLGDCGFFDDQPVELLEGEIWVKFPEPGESGLPYPSCDSHPRLWTKADYYRLGELGFFEGQRVELWEGEIVVMSPQGPFHYSAVDRVADVLRRYFEPAQHVRMQGPLDLRLLVEPEPDAAVVSPGDYSHNHPQAALLVVEVSDSSLAVHRGSKASLYAQGAIADYWIVNLVDDQLEVYRNPQPDPSQTYGHAYADRTTLGRTDVVSPLAVPQFAIPVAELLG